MKAKKYKIALQEVSIDGDDYVEATVAEFPDVAIYEQDPSVAYDLAVETVEGLIEMAEDMGHPIPKPSERVEESYSGKMTFRPGKRLHREIAAEADREGLSQNQWLCNVVVHALATSSASTAIKAAVDYALSNVLETTSVRWNTSIGGTLIAHEAEVAPHVFARQLAGGRNINIYAFSDADDDSAPLTEIGSGAATAMPEQKVSTDLLVHREKYGKATA
jgi:antitoxin HicB